MFRDKRYKKSRRNLLFHGVAKYTKLSPADEFRLWFKTLTVFGITAARFKIGHTLQKFPCIPQATFCFIAYHSQSRKNYYIMRDAIFQVFFKIYYVDFSSDYSPVFSHYAHMVISPYSASYTLT